GPLRLLVAGRADRARRAHRRSRREAPEPGHDRDAGHVEARHRGARGGRGRPLGGSLPPGAGGRCGARRDHPALAQDAGNTAAVERARHLIDARQYVLDSNWGDVQPRADDENAYLESHSFEEYAAWHLGLTEGATDETKSRYAFVYGDFRRVHRTGLI